MKPWSGLLIALALLACKAGQKPGSAPAPSTRAAATNVPAGTALLAGPSTHGVIAGVLRFQDSSVTSFSDELRKDRELFDAMRARGVPAENLSLLLDESATASGVHDAVVAAARRAKPEDTLLFYYAGHGARDKDGSPYFLAFDTRGAANGIGIDALGDTLVEHFRGARVVLMADCCYSGTLRLVAERLSARGVAAATVTSADASNLSTENWTFTQTVIDALGGDPLSDGDGNGRITLGELAGEVAAAMKNREHQRHGFWQKGVPLDSVLAKAGARPPAVAGARFAPGTYVRAERRGEVGVARVRDAGAKTSVVRFYHYNKAEDVIVEAGDLSALSFERFAVGSKLDVLWGGKIWDARVVRTEGDFHFITYPGWPSYWDEWILSDRVAGKPAGGGRITVGASVSVEWRGKWYPATVLKQSGSRYLVHYRDYDSSWDEWVTAGRIRKS